MMVMEEDGDQITCQHIYNNKYKKESIEKSELCTLTDCMVKYAEREEKLRSECEAKRNLDMIKERTLLQKEKKLNR